MSPAPCCRRIKRGGPLAISPASGLWNCFACGAKGNWLGFTRKAGAPIADAYSDGPKIDTTVYDRLRAKMRRPVTGGQHPAVLAACLARGILPATLDAWRVSTLGPENLRWPIYAWEDGTWKQATARLRRVLGRDDETKTGPADWFEVSGGPTCLAIGNHLLGVEPPLWSENRPPWAPEWLDPSRATPDAAARLGSPVPAVRRILAVEGQWDAMVAFQLGIPNALSLANGASHVDVAGLMRYVPEDAEVWIATDMDAAGEKAAEAFFAQLGGQCRRLTLPHKDLNDWLKAKPDLTAEDVFETVEGRKKKGDGKRVYLDISKPLPFEPKKEIVIETPWPRLTRRLAGGLRAGWTTGILAPSGSGKTTLASQIAVHAAQFAVKVGIVQLESQREEIIAKLKKQIEGWCRWDGDEELAVLQSCLKLSPLEGKEIRWEDTIEELNDMAAVEGCKLLIIDNWDFLACEGDGSRMKMKAYSAFQRICKENDAHGIVIWQPNKVDRGSVVNSGQQKGFAQALQDSDVYITMNKHGLCRRLDVEKARVDETAEDLSTIWLRYNPKTGCLDETDSHADLKPVDDMPPPT